MAAADPILPPEEVALLELEQVAVTTPPDKMPPAPTDHLGDPDVTLPWDRCQPEPVEPSRRSSPEGGPQEVAPSCPPPEAEDEDPLGLPTVTTHSFVPIDPQCIERAPSKQQQQQQHRGWHGQEGQEGQGSCVAPQKGANISRAKQLLLPTDPPRYRDPLGFEGRVAAAAPQCPGARQGCAQGSLQAVGSVLGALLLCPCLLYGAFVFLPFDAPLLPTLTARLVYTLRCATFATVPIVLGMMVAGISQLCCWALEPQGALEPRGAAEPLGALRREVELHRSFVSQSSQLFSLFFLNLAALATFLPQELLKLLPLLAGFFAIARLVFWLSYALGRSFRTFSFSLTFLPLLAMLIWNLYSLLVLEPHQLLALAQPQEVPKESRAKLRLWG